MLRLGLASSIPEIQEALSDPETGLYDVNRHMYLRRNYVVVYVGPESRSIDTHKHYVEGGGYTEHTEFIDKLQRPEELELIARGPKSSNRKLVWKYWNFFVHLQVVGWRLEQRKVLETRVQIQCCQMLREICGRELRRRVNSCHLKMWRRVITAALIAWLVFGVEAEEGSAVGSVKTAEIIAGSIPKTISVRMDASTVRFQKGNVIK